MKETTLLWIQALNDAFGFSLVFFLVRGKYNLKYYVKVFLSLLLMTTLFTLTDMPFQFRTLLVVIMVSILLYMFASEPIKNSLITFCVTIVILVASNVVAVVLGYSLEKIHMNEYTKFFLVYCLSVLPGALVGFIVHKLLLRLKVFDSTTKKFNSFWGILLFFILSLVMVMTFALNLIESIPDSTFFNLMIFLIMAIIMCGAMIFFLMLNWQVERKNMELAHQQSIIEQNIQYTETVESMIDDIRSYRHDLKNMILALDGHIREGKLEKIKQFYDQCIMGMEGQRDISLNQVSQLRYINDAAIKGLLYIKIQQALHAGVNVNINVNQPITFEGIPSIDLCRVLGILLDNAIEAAIESSCGAVPGELSFYIEQKEGNVLLIITNTFINELHLEDLYMDGFTTKGKDRGIGLKSIRSMLQRYSNLCLDWKIDKHVNCILSLENSIKSSV